MAAANTSYSSLAQRETADQAAHSMTTLQLLVAISPFFFSDPGRAAPYVFDEESKEAIQRSQLVCTAAGWVAAFNQRNQCQPPSPPLFNADANEKKSTGQMEMSSDGED